MKNVLPCLCCGKELDYAGPESHRYVNQPSNGTAFSTYGHWGSTFFDSMAGDERLEIAVCDDCLRKHESRTRIIDEVTQEVIETQLPRRPRRGRPRKVPSVLGPEVAGESGGNV